MSSQFMRVINVLEQQKKGVHALPANEKMRDVLLVVCNADDEGITTREVADKCDLSVYSARNWLMKLESEGRIYKKTRPRNSTWHHM